MAAAFKERKTYTFRERVILEGGFGSIPDEAWIIGNGSDNTASTTDSHATFWNGANFPDPNYPLTIGLTPAGTGDGLEFNPNGFSAVGSERELLIGGINTPIAMYQITNNYMTVGPGDTLDDFQIIGGYGGSTTANSTAAGYGTGVYIYSGTGGGTTGTSASAGGAGSISLQSGNGGSATNTSSNAGEGGYIGIYSGNGGASTLAAGGQAGSIVIMAGSGGSGGTTAGDGGYISINAGTKGSSGTGGFDGAIFINDSQIDSDIIMSGTTASNLLLLDAGLNAVQIGTSSPGVIADFRSTAIVFNEASNDVDFRVESNGNAEMLFVDGGNDRVLIGTTTGLQPLTVAGNAVFNSTVTGGSFGGQALFTYIDSAGTYYAGLWFGSDTTAPTFNNVAIQKAGTGTVVNGASTVRITVNGVDKLQANANDLVINEGSNDYDFRVETNGQTHAIYADGGLDKLAFLGSTIDTNQAITFNGTLKVPGGSASTTGLGIAFESGTNAAGMYENNPGTSVSGVTFYGGGSQQCIISNGGIASNGFRRMSINTTFDVQADNGTNTTGLRIRYTANKANSSGTHSLFTVGESVNMAATSTGINVTVGIVPTYNQSGSAGGTDLLINRTETAIGSGNHYLIDAKVGGSSKFTVGRTGNVSITGTINGQFVGEIDTSDDAIFGGFVEAAELEITSSLTLTGTNTIVGLTERIVFDIDGGGSAITTGQKHFLTIPFDCTVTSWTIIADQTGDIVVDVKKSDYASYPTTSSIAGSEKPSLSSVQKNRDINLSTWTTSITAGDILEFIVDSAADVEKVSITLEVVRT